MKPADAIDFISDPSSPALDVLKAADELFARNLIYVHSGSQTGDEMMQGILHALVKLTLQREQRELS